MTDHPRSGLAAASPSRGQHQRTGGAGSAVFAWVRSLFGAGRGALVPLLACAALCVQAAAAQEWHGREPPPAVGGALDLIDHQGERFALSRVAGRPALVFFGFTHCGSTCPQALATAREVLHTLGSADATVLFVTLDPLSDGPEQLRSFVQRLDPRIVGLTGSPQQIEQAAERYGVSLRVQAGAIEHSSMFYLLDASSRVQRVYPHNTSAPDLVADIRRLRAPSDASSRPTALASAKRQPLGWGAASPSP